jgi:rhodanese-related sulfurtransferase
MVTGRFELGHIPGAIRGRIDDPDTTIALLGDDLDREIVVYCTDQACTGSALAAKLLEDRGYRNVLRGESTLGISRRAVRRSS